MTHGDMIRGMDNEALAIMFHEMLAEHDHSILESLKSQGVDADLIEIPAISVHRHIAFLEQEAGQGEEQ